MRSEPIENKAHSYSSSYQSHHGHYSQAGPRHDRHDREGEVDQESFLGQQDRNRREMERRRADATNLSMGFDRGWNRADEERGDAPRPMGNFRGHNDEQHQQYPHDLQAERQAYRDGYELG